MLPLEDELKRLSNRVVPLERFVELLSSQLEAPVFFRSADEAGFRFRNPDYRHFVLLRVCRMVSGLNAALALARSGYPQEIGVILRTVIEYFTQVEYVLLHRDPTGKPVGNAAEFTTDYFRDDRRTGPTAQSKRVKLNQKDVHNAVGRSLDEFTPKDIHQRTASQLMSHVYLVFSNYVHGRYPESMDLFGGRPGHFHLRGMRGTPKDNENVEVIDTLIASVSNCLMQIVQSFQLYELVDADSILASLYQDCVGRRPASQTTEGS
jgi:hypothetical protein